jgi:hypothetical protein
MTSSWEVLVTKRMVSLTGNTVPMCMDTHRKPCLGEPETVLTFAGKFEQTHNFKPVKNMLTEEIVHGSNKGWFTWALEEV